MAELHQPNQPKRQHKCLVCCTIRSGTVGAVASGLAGLFVAIPFDWYKHRLHFRWAMETFYRSESFATGLVVGGAISFGILANLAENYPLLNKGCDSDIPFWSWNGAIAGAIGGAITGVGTWATMCSLVNKVPKWRQARKHLIYGVIGGTLVGGTVLTDYWKLTVVDRMWGDKCNSPHRPRRFPIPAIPDK